jgi:integrase
MRYWAAWHLLRLGQPMQLPLQVSTVLQFIIDHAQRQTAGACSMKCHPKSMKPWLQPATRVKRAPSHSTLVHRMAVMSKAHQVHAMPNPCQDGAVKELMSRTRKAYARRGELPQKKEALTRDVLEELLASCDDSLRGLRDRALLLFAWASGGRRRSEVAGADMRFLRTVANGEFIYTLSHSKTNQSGTDAPKITSPLPAVQPLP